MKLNTNLEDVLNLAPAEDEPEAITPVSVPPSLATQDTLDRVDKIAAALPEVKGLESSDEELDDLASKATEAYKDILDLGFNVEMKYAAEIFAAAGNMMAHAITAKTNKIQKKLKMIELQIKKQRVDQYEVEANKPPPASIPGTAKPVELDRNQIVNQALKKQNG